MREASSLVLAARLNAEGAAVSAYDPVAEERGAQADAGARLRGLGAGRASTDADAVVLVTEWPELIELDWREVARGDARRRS